MASPQKENGYTQIANEILERLSYPGINGSEFRVINVILRKTYGFHKKSDWISLSQFQKATLMNRAQAVQTIKSLLEKKILKKENGQFVFNKNYEEWLVCKRILPQSSMQKHTPPSMQKHTKSSMQKHTHKRKKETITKETIATPSVAGEINQLIDCFKDVNPSYRLFYSNKTQRSSLERLCELHGVEQVRGVISILSETNKIPYVPQVTTPYQLEQKWASLANALIKKKQELQKINVFKV